MCMCELRVYRFHEMARTRVAKDVDDDQGDRFFVRVLTRTSLTAVNSERPILSKRTVMLQTQVRPLRCREMMSLLGHASYSQSILRFYSYTTQTLQT